MSTKIVNIEQQMIIEARRLRRLYKEFRTNNTLLFYAYRVRYAILDVRYSNIYSPFNFEPQNARQSP